MKLRSRSAILAGILAALVCGAAAAAPAALTLDGDDRDALTRVAIAEAANQGDSGLAAVVQTILNRLASGAWGGTVEAVVDAPHQFEPVARVGGDWRRLKPPTEAQRARVDTILALVADGRMPDFIGGALYFQNPKIVASRIAAGVTRADRLNFGGRTRVAIVGEHAFYAGSPARLPAAPKSLVGPIFVVRPAPAGDAASPSASVAASSSSPPQAEPERGLFILSDGRLAQEPARPDRAR